MATVWNHDPETVNARLDNLMQEINDTVAITDEEKRQEATKNVQTNINRTLLISVLMKNPELLEKCKCRWTEFLKSVFFFFCELFSKLILFDFRQNFERRSFENKSCDSNGLLVGLPPLQWPERRSGHVLERA